MPHDVAHLLPRWPQAAAIRVAQENRQNLASLRKTVEEMTLVERRIEAAADLGMTALWEYVSDLLALVDRNGVVCRVNEPQWRRVLGYKHEDVLGRQWGKFVGTHGAIRSASRHVATMTAANGSRVTVCWSTTTIVDGMSLAIGRVCHEKEAAGNACG